MVKAAKKRGKRSRRKPVEMPVRFVISIDNWDWSYWLGINAGHDLSEPYNEFRHLHLTGKLLRPSSLKVERVQLTFIPNALYNHHQWHKHTIAHVGTLRLDRGTLDGLFSLPSDVLPSLLTMLTGQCWMRLVASECGELLGEPWQRCAETSAYLANCANDNSGAEEYFGMRSTSPRGRALASDHT